MLKRCQRTMHSVQGPVLPSRARHAFSSPGRHGCRNAQLTPKQLPKLSHSSLSYARGLTNQAAAAGTSDVATATVVPTANVWELDFCSRPLLDERGKKIWEVLVCDPVRSFSYSRYLPSNKINSAEVRTRAGPTHLVSRNEHAPPIHS